MKPNRLLAPAAVALLCAFGEPAFAAEAPGGSVPRAGAPSSAGRTSLDQPGCALCIVGTPVVQWSGNVVSLHVDRIENRTDPWKADIGLYVALTSAYPEIGVPVEIGPGADLFELYYSDIVWLAPLSMGSFHSNVDSGTLRFDGSRVPAGEYWMSVVVFDCPYPCLYQDYVVMADKASCDGSQCTLKGGGPPPTLPAARLLPIVVDVSNGTAHYTTEMALTNNTLGRLTVSMLYTASLGSKSGSGTVTDSLAPGEQKMIGDVLAYLREEGLAIPPPEEESTQGGTLLVTFEGNRTIDPRLVSVTGRTAAWTSVPHPVGRAGLAYSGLLPTDSSSTSLTLFGLRSTPTDRTNVAVFSTSADPVTLKVTIHSGSGDGGSVVFREAETLPPYGWLQYGSAQILDANGITNGWVTVERASESGSFSAYAVINDSKTNDGSFVPPVGTVLAGSTLTVPQLGEEFGYRSELVLANKSGSPATLNLDYHESDSFGPGSGGPMALELAPFEQRIVPDAIALLRANGVDMRRSSTSGSLQITVSGTETGNVFAGARTGSQSPGGGQFGLFTPGAYSGAEASTEAYLYGLRADSENEIRVAGVNTGLDSDGPILLQFQAYDGDAGGIPKGEPITFSLRPGVSDSPDRYLWESLFFTNSGVSNGWVKVTRMSGTAPWIAYAEVHDLRTGDGAYVPMVK